MLLTVTHFNFIEVIRLYSDNFLYRQTDMVTALIQTVSDTFYTLIVFIKHEYYCGHLTPLQVVKKILV